MPSSEVELSVGYELARRVRALCPGWIETNEGPAHWRFEDPDEDYLGRHVIIDVRDRVLRVLPVGEGVHVGPSVIGWYAGMTVNVTLPHVSDRHDRDGAIKALIVIGALSEPADG